MTTQRIVQPPNNVPLVSEDQSVESIWSQFFTALVSSAAPIDTVVLPVSPALFVATFPGNLLIANGTVSALSLTRARVTVPLPMTSGFIPLAQGDELTVTYSILPDAYFIPNMGGAGGA